MLVNKRGVLNAKWCKINVVDARKQMEVFTKNQEWIRRGLESGSLILKTLDSLLDADLVKV
jgi:hypothetical protein